MGKTMLCECCGSRVNGKLDAEREATFTVESNKGILYALCDHCYNNCSCDLEGFPVHIEETEVWDTLRFYNMQEE